jgi:hypothetical protein
MSMTAVRSYFKARCIALGMKEHDDGFNEDNVASTVLDNSFHVLLGNFSGRKLNQSDQEMDCPVTVTFWVKGFRRPVEGLDKAILKSELLVKETLKNSNRLGQSIKNVTLGSVNFAALSDDNDNAVKVTLSFTALISLAII